MSSQISWKRVGVAVRRVAERGAAAVADSSANLSSDPLPDVAVLEDRLLFNGAPVDGVVLDAGEGAGTSGEPVLSDELSAVSTAAAEASGNEGLLADDRYISVNPADRIIANYGIGGGGKNPQYRYVGGGIVEDGWGPYVEQRFQWALDSGVKRILLHMPFGHRTYVVDPVSGRVSAAPGEVDYQFDAYLDAQEQIPKVTETFVPVFKQFIEENTASGKLTDAIVYIGSPRLDPDQVALINNPEAWWDRAYQILTPLLDAGFRSIGFDASASVTPDMLDFELHEVLRNPELRDPVRDAPLIAAVGNEPIEVYLEAVPYRASGRTDFGVMLLDWAWERQDPDKPGPHQDTHKIRFFEHDQFTGEIVRMVRHEQWESEGLAPLEKILLDGHKVAIPDALVLYPHLFGAETLDQLIDRLDLPSLPTLVDLDPEDVNPETAEYEITTGPKFGTLMTNRFHEDVFTYTPNAYFTGVDSFEYVVRDASGATATAVVQFFVNTEVVVPGEPEPPPAPGPVDPPPAPGPVDPPPAPGPVDPPEVPEPPEPPDPPETPTQPPSNPPPVNPEPPHEEPTGGSPPPQAPAPPDSRFIDSVLPFARSPRGGLSPVAPEVDGAVEPVPSVASLPSSPPGADNLGNVEQERLVDASDSSAEAADETTEPERSATSSSHLPGGAANPAASPSSTHAPSIDAADSGPIITPPHIATRGSDNSNREDRGAERSSPPAAVRQPPEFVYRPHANRLEEDEPGDAWYDLLPQADPGDTTELEGAGFVAGVFALERIAHASAPAAAGKGSSILQFLSEVRNWIPHR